MIRGSFPLLHVPLEPAGICLISADFHTIFEKEAPAKAFLGNDVFDKHLKMLDGNPAKFPRVSVCILF